MATTPITPGRPGIGGGAPIVPIYPPIITTPPDALLISVSDSTTLTEDLSPLRFSLLLSVSDSTTLTDTPTVQRTPLLASTTDSTTASDTVSVRLTTVVPSTTDTVTLGESVLLFIISQNTINLLEPVLVNDSPTLLRMLLLASTADTATLSDAATLLVANNGVEAADAITVSESVTLAPHLVIEVDERATFTEVVTASIPAPDVPPPPVITTDPGSILCSCVGVFEATEVDCFAFAATTVKLCNLAAVHVDIVIANLNANCAGPTFNVPLPPIVGGPGGWLPTVSDTITVNETVSLLLVDLCPGLTGPAVLDFGDLEYFNDGVDQVSPCQITYDPADYPGLTGIRIRGSIAIEDLAYETLPELHVVDDNGTVYWTATGLTYTPDPDDTYFSRAFFDDVVTLHLTDPHTYYLKWSKQSVAGGGFQAFNVQAWVFFTASDQAKFQLPMLRGLFLDGTGLYQGSTNAIDTYTRINGQTNGAIVPIATGAFSEVDYREIYIVADSFTGAGTVGLWDVQAAAILAGTEIVIAAGAGDSATFPVYTLQVAESLFTSGHDLEFREKHTVLNQKVILVSADLNVKVGSPTLGYFTAPDLCAEAAEVYVRNGIDDCETVYRQRAYWHVDTYWPASTIFYFEGSEASGFFNTLIDTGTIATPELTAVVTIAFTDSGFSQERSAAITLTTDHLYASARDGFGESTTPDADTKTFVVGAISGP